MLSMCLYAFPGTLAEFLRRNSNGRKEVTDADLDQVLQSCCFRQLHPHGLFITIHTYLSSTTTCVIRRWFSFAGTWSRRCFSFAACTRNSRSRYKNQIKGWPTAQRSTCDACFNLRVMKACDLRICLRSRESCCETNSIVKRVYYIAYVRAGSCEVQAQAPRSIRPGSPPPSRPFRSTRSRRSMLCLRVLKRPAPFTFPAPTFEYMY